MLRIAQIEPDRLIPGQVGPPVHLPQPGDAWLDHQSAPDFRPRSLQRGGSTSWPAWPPTPRRAWGRHSGRDGAARSFPACGHAGVTTGREARRFSLRRILVFTSSGGIWILAAGRPGRLRHPPLRAGAGQRDLFRLPDVHGGPGFPFCRRGSLVVTPSRAGNRPAAWVMEFCVGELADGTTSRSGGGYVVTSARLAVHSEPMPGPLAWRQYPAPRTVSMVGSPSLRRR